VAPVFKELYKSVSTGKEAERVIENLSGKDYQKMLAKELGVMGGSEMWRAGSAVRSLRPKEKAKAITKETKGVGGRKA
jgi:ketol-acid reductoisomerase